MARQAAERASVLVLRAWLEPHGPPLRVRITGRVDVQAAEDTSVTVAGAEAASKLVRDWLLRLEARSTIIE
jgi:hypothetical protein